MMMRKVPWHIHICWACDAVRRLQEKHWIEVQWLLLQKMESREGGKEGDTTSSTCLHLEVRPPHGHPWLVLAVAGDQRAHVDEPYWEEDGGACND